MIKILIIDDAVDFLKILEQALKNDFEIETATGVSQALSLLAQEKSIDLICSDLNMSDGTGLDILIALKKTEKNIPFILMTGSDDCIEIRMAKQYGAFLVPKGESDFLSRVKEIAYEQCRNI